MLDNEIKKYVDAKRSDRVQEAYKSWIDRKQLSSPRIPSHCEARARPLSCYNEETIHEFHKKKLSQKIKNSNLVSSRPQTSPRQTFERVKKIQELRNLLISRDENGIPREKPSVEVPKQRESTPPSSNISKNISPKKSNVSQSKSSKSNDLVIHAYRISKQSETKITSSPTKESPRKRKKRRKPRTPQAPVPDDSSFCPEFQLKVDNYFKQPSSPSSSSTPDSGFGEDSPSPQPRLELPADTTNLEIESVHSDAETALEKPEDTLQSVLEKAEISTKTVRFSDNILYDTDNRAHSFGNSTDQLRSCIKARNIRSG